MRVCTCDIHFVNGRVCAHGRSVSVDVLHNKFNSLLTEMITPQT